METVRKSKKTSSAENELRLDPAWVQILINLRMKYATSFTRKKYSAATTWKKIHDEMMECGVPGTVTPDRIRKKWMNLIARYKILKASRKTEISWPYFEQIDRAYAKHPSLIELRRPADHLKLPSADGKFDFVVSKQHFTGELIRLRTQYRHMFTGKKMAAHAGWKAIQLELPDGERYTLEQISKCWQNLAHRYRSMLAHHPDTADITWAHFPAMHALMTMPDNYRRAYKVERVANPASEGEEVQDAQPKKQRRKSTMPTRLIKEEAMDFIYIRDGDDQKQDDDGETEDNEQLKVRLRSEAELCIAGIQDTLQRWDKILPPRPKMEPEAGNSCACSHCYEDVMQYLIARDFTQGDINSKLLGLLSKLTQVVA